MAIAQITSVRPSDVPAGMVLVSKSNRSSKSKTVTDAQKFRGFLAPELQVMDVPSKYTQVLLATLDATRDAMFAAYICDSEGNFRADVPQEVDTDRYTLDNVLRYWAQDQESKRLNKESLEAWFIASAFPAYLLAKKGAATVEAWREKFLKLSSPNSGITRDEAAVMLAAFATVGQETDSLLSEQIVGRLSGIINRAESTKIEAL